VAYFPLFALKLQLLVQHLHLTWLVFLIVKGVF
jgi:hypothetical protein